jgi:hypothetical protein
MVMATGVVSIAAHFLGYDIVGWILLGINAAACLALFAIPLCRLLRHPRAVHTDIVDHGRGRPFSHAHSDRGARAASYGHIMSSHKPCRGCWVSQPDSGSSSRIRSSPQ